jgi:hypothetical protein
MQSGLINQFPWDPVGMNSKDMAVKEVKNGRLAMVSSLIFFLEFSLMPMDPSVGSLSGALQAGL